MIRALLLSLLLFVSIAAPAQALLCAPLTGCTCTVRADDIAFTNVNPLLGVSAAQGDVAVDCTGVIDVAPSVVVQINRGAWGTIAGRKLHASTGDLLDYNIYTSVGHGTIWGDGSGGSTALSVTGGLLTLQHWTASRTMYGVAAPNVSTRPGAYSDTVVVRIDW